MTWPEAIVTCVNILVIGFIMWLVLRNRNEQ
jgi:hypothetical protein